MTVNSRTDLKEVAGLLLATIEPSPAKEKIRMSVNLRGKTKEPISNGRHFTRQAAGWVA